MIDDTPQRRLFLATAGLAGMGMLAAASGASAAPIPGAEAPHDPSGGNTALLRWVADRIEIQDLIQLYGFSFDKRDWALHRSLFLDEIEMDFSASIGSGLAAMKADDWVAGVKPFFENLPATQHITYPQLVNIDGDQAFVVSLLHAQHFLPNTKGEPVERMIGWYENWLTRTKQGWRYRKMVQHIDWNEGNWWIFDKAAGKAK